MGRIWKIVACGAAVLAVYGCGGGGDDGDAGVGMTATLDGANAPALSVSSGQSATLDIASGQDIRLSTREAVTWSVSAVKTNISQKVQSSNVWEAVLKSPEGGSVTLVAKSLASPQRTTTIQINVPPHRYTAVPYKVGGATTFRDVGTLSNGSPLDNTYTVTTTAIDGSGVHTSTSVSASNVHLDTLTVDSDGNRLTRDRIQEGYSCTYGPKREHLRFPMYVGQSWNSNWAYRCTSGYQEDAALKATVEAFEPVTVGSKSYDALRIRYNVVFTNSNDGNFVDGGAGNATYRSDYTCWWATDIGRTLKCEFDNTYNFAITPPDYYVHYTQTAQTINE